MQAAMRKKVADGAKVVNRWLTQAQCTGREDTYTGKRRFPRFTWREHFTVVVLDEGPDRVECFATTRDISAGGVGLKIRHRIAATAVVRLVHEETGETVHGRVRFCNEALGAFFVGVEFIQAPPACPTLAATNATRFVA